MIFSKPVIVDFYQYLEESCQLKDLAVILHSRYIVIRKVEFKFPWHKSISNRIKQNFRF